MKETKIVELVIDEDSQELAIDAISLVSAPAIEQDFVFFGKEKNNLTFAKVDEEKRMLVSPALIPNKQIFRYNPNTDSEYYVYFSPETVRKASELYLKNNNHHKATHEHSERVSGVLTVESWIKEGDSDKSKLYGFDLPNGTWFVKMKIENEDLWQKIKDGSLRGLSIEGYFTDRLQKMSETVPTTEEIRTALKELLSKKKSIKVNLSLIDDIDYASEFLNKTFGYSNESIEKAIQLNKELDSLKSSAKAVIKEVDADYSDINKWSEKGKKAMVKYSQAAKDLGVKPEQSQEYKRLSKLIDEGYQRGLTAKDWIRATKANFNL